MRVLLVLAALSALAVLGAGYLGGRHPAGDSFAPFRLHAAVVALVASLLLLPIGPAWLAVLMILPALAGLVRPLGHHLDPAGPGSVAVYQKNLHFRTDDVAGVVWEVERTRPDVLIVQEVSPTNEELLPLLARSHPTQHRCANVWIGNTAILARWPALPGTAGCLDGAAYLRVMAPGGPLWLVSVHLRWPWPLEQLAQARRLAEGLAALDGPMVIAGDMNGAAWSHAVGLLAEATGARPLPPVGPTHRVAGVVPVAIDHVLATGPGTLERRPPARSDHHGLLARVDPFAWPTSARLDG